MVRYRSIRRQQKAGLGPPPVLRAGFYTISDFAEIQYKCTGTYNNKGESGFLWNDPEIGIDWPNKNPTLSGKDEKAQTFAQWLETPESDNFQY